MGFEPLTPRTCATWAGNAPDGGPELGIFLPIWPLTPYGGFGLSWRAWFLGRAVGA
jgi:hypothetical protein